MVRYNPLALSLPKCACGLEASYDKLRTNGNLDKLTTNGTGGWIV